MKKSLQGRGSEPVQRVDIAIGFVPVAESERHIDGIGVEAERIVADAAMSHERLAFRQSLARLAWVGHRQGERTEDVRTVESDSGLMADLENLPEPDRIRAVAIPKGGFAEIEEATLQEAPGAQALDQIKHGRGLLSQPGQIGHREQAEDAGDPSIDLGAQVANLCGGLGGRDALLERLGHGPEIEHRVGDLAAVRDLDATEPVLSGEIDAPLQIAVGRDHPAADVFGIAETAERLGLQLDRVDLLRDLKTLAVLRQTAGNVVAREVQVAAEEMDPGALLAQRIPLRRGGRPVEIGEGAIDVVGDTFDRGQPEPGLGPLLIRHGGLEGALEGGP